MLTQESFAEQVTRYITIEGHIKENGKMLNELRKKKREIGQSLLEYMQEKGIVTCAISTKAGAELVRKAQRSVQTLKRDHVEEILAKEMQDPNRAEELTDLLWDTRGVTEKEILKYAEPSAKKKADMIKQATAVEV